VGEKKDAAAAEAEYAEALKAREKED